MHSRALPETCCETFNEEGVGINRLAAIEFVQQETCAEANDQGKRHGRKGVVVDVESARDTGQQADMRGLKSERKKRSGGDSTRANHEDTQGSYFIQLLY